MGSKLGVWNGERRCKDEGEGGGCNWNRGRGRSFVFASFLPAQGFDGFWASKLRELTLMLDPSNNRVERFNYVQTRETGG